MTYKNIRVGNFISSHQTVYLIGGNVWRSFQLCWWLLSVRLQWMIVIFVISYLETCSPFLSIMIFGCLLLNNFFYLWCYLTRTSCSLFKCYSLFNFIDIDTNGCAILFQVPLKICFQYCVLLSSNFLMQLDNNYNLSFL